MDTRYMIGYEDTHALDDSAAPMAQYWLIEVAFYTGDMVEFGYWCGVRFVTEQLPVVLYVVSRLIVFCVFLIIETVKAIAQCLEKWDKEWQSNYYLTTQKRQRL